MKKASLLIIVLFLLVSCSQTGKSEKEVETENPSSQSNRAVQMSDSIPVANEDIGRTEWQNPQLVLSTIGDMSGKVVADIGAGSGYFAFKLAQSAKKVIALDIDPKALEYIDSQIEIMGNWAKNIETRITKPDVPNLTQEEADAVLIVNTYFYIPKRIDYLQKLFDSISENGRLVVVDYKIGETPVGPSNDFKVKPEEIEADLRKAGFKSVYIDLQSLQYQYVISAEKR